MHQSRISASVGNGARIIYSGSNADTPVLIRILSSFFRNCLSRFQYAAVHRPLKGVEHSASPVHGVKGCRRPRPQTSTRVEHRLLGPLAWNPNVSATTKVFAGTAKTCGGGKSSEASSASVIRNEP